MDGEPDERSDGISSSRRYYAVVVGRASQDRLTTKSPSQQVRRLAHATC